MLLAVGLGGLAWVVLAIWSVGPYARYLDHDGLDASSLGPVALIGVFVGSWTLMLVAMMLPSTYPLLVAFERVVARRPRRLLLLSGVVAGYLAVWILVGYVAYVGDGILHGLEEQFPALLADDAWVLAGVLALAGVFQFTPWKYQCLDKCRSPRAYVMTHWSGRRSPAHAAFSLGWAHGLSCVGCCWALMLVMFAVGHGNLAWMLVLGAVMTVEKVLPVGRRLAAPIGFALLGAAVWTLLA